MSAALTPAAIETITASGRQVRDDVGHGLAPDLRFDGQQHGLGARPWPTSFLTGARHVL